MKKLIAAVALAASLAACGGGSTTTATERTLCSDLRAGAPVEVIYADANAVNEDMTTSIDHDLVIEVLGYTAAVDGLPLSDSVEAETDRLIADCAAIGQ